MLRKYQKQLRESVFTECLGKIERLGLSDYFTATVSPMQIVCRANGSQILFGGLDNQEKIKSIADISWLWMEEATEFTADDFTQLDIRVRSGRPNPQRLYLSFNPISQQNWVYPMFFARSGEADRPALFDRLLTIHSTYQTNPYLTAQQRQVFDTIKQTRPRYYSVYGLGEWGSPDDLVIGPLPQVDSVPSSAKLVCYGLDFGFNDPCALVALYRDDGRFYAQEVIYRTNLTVGALADEMKRLGVDPYAYIYFDSSRPEMAAGLRAAGFNAVRANKSVAAGIDAVNDHKAKGLLYTVRDNVNLNKELAVYAWRRDKDGHILEVPEDGFDHAVDALRYGLFTYLKAHGYGGGLSL